MVADERRRQMKLLDQINSLQGERRKTRKTKNPSQRVCGEKRGIVGTCRSYTCSGLVSPWKQLRLHQFLQGSRLKASGFKPSCLLVPSPTFLIIMYYYSPSFSLLSPCRARPSSLPTEQCLVYELQSAGVCDLRHPATMPCKSLSRWLSA